MLVCIFLYVYTHIVAVQHSKKFWVCDELDSRRLEEMADLLLIDRGGGACKQATGHLGSLYNEIFTIHYCFVNQPMPFDVH